MSYLNIMMLKIVPEKLNILYVNNVVFKDQIHRLISWRANQCVDFSTKNMLTWTTRIFIKIRRRNKKTGTLSIWRRTIEFYVDMEEN